VTAIDSEIGFEPTPPTEPTTPTGPTTSAEPQDAVIVVADDLIWAERLTRSVMAAGARPIRATTPTRLDGALAEGSASAAIVDLGGRAYDGLAVVARISATGIPILAVGQHDDVDARKAARAAGALRVLAYRKLASDGPAVVTSFLAGLEATRR